MTLRSIGLLSVAVVFAVGCAAPAPTATPTTPPAAAVTPTPTKAPTATPTKRPLVKVSIASSSNSLSYVTPFVGRALGYWQEEGLDVDWISAGGGAKALAAVVGGSVEISMNSFAPEVIKAIDAGQKIKAITANVQRGAFFLVLSKEIAQQRGVSQKSSLVDRAKALKGLTIAAFSVGGSSHLSLKRILAEANLDPERDLTITFIGNEAALVAAMSQKQIDGFLQVPPSPIQSVARGDAIVLVSAPAGDMYWLGDQVQNGMIALEQTISGKPDIMDGAVRAVWRSQRTFNEEPARTAKALRTLDFYAEIDEQAFNMSIEMMQGLVPKEPLLTQQQFDDLVKNHNSEANPADQTKITKGQLFDEGPALRAKKQLSF